jgi:hypothetical protein
MELVVMALCEVMTVHTLLENGTACVLGGSANKSLYLHEKFLFRIDSGNLYFEFFSVLDVII